MARGSHSATHRSITSRFAAPCAGSAAQEADELGAPRPRPLPLLRCHPGEHRRDRVAVRGRGTDPEFAAQQRADDRLKAQVRGDDHLAPVRRRGEPLEVAPGRLPRRLGQERIAGGLDRERAVVLLEVHRVEHDRLGRALLHRRLQAHARRDRVRQARRARSSPARTTDRARRTPGPGGSCAGTRPTRGLKSSISPCSAAELHRAVDLLLDRRLALVERPLPVLAGIAEREPVGRLQRGGGVVPGAAPVLEADRPAAAQVAVNRRLGVDRDVLVQRRAALRRRVPGEVALGRRRAGCRRGLEALDRRRRLGSARPRPRS